jgi:hypothetical protein
MARLGGTLGSIAENTVPFRAPDCLVPAGQGCAATRYPRAAVRLHGPTWESPASIRNTLGFQSCRAKPTLIAAATSRSSGIG